jgi:hypothetical protein
LLRSSFARKNNVRKVLFFVKKKQKTFTPVDARCVNARLIPGAVETDPSAARKRFFLKKKQKLLLSGARGAAALML